MCPITTWVCDGIKGIIRHQGHIVPIELTPEQCIAIGQVLGKLGFVNEMGENPLELIQDRNVEEPEQGPKCLECPE